MKLATKKWILVAVASLSMVAVGTGQIREILKVLGVGAAVQKFGPDINKAINKLAGHKDTDATFTKVVPILTVGIGKSSAIGAAQVTGKRSNVEKVRAVAAPETELFGKEIRIRALIPISNDKVDQGIKKVEGVGISGIVDLKL
jgi:hypothetical protein